MSDATERVRALVERCVDAIEDGRRADIATLLASDPDVQDEVRNQLDTLERAGLLSHPHSAPTLPERLGEFRLIRQLGRGGMGVVYLAEQDRLQRTVALKLMHPETMYFPNARERFEREVQAAAGLRHPGIVPVHTFGEADGVPFYAMERVIGASLAEVLAQVAGTPCERLDAPALRVALGKALEAKGEDAQVAMAPLFTGTWVRACCRIIGEVARALQHAHEHGVLHRDLKPSNILLDADGQVLLIDFGLALARNDARITRTGAMLGSLPYMAPEQIRGESAAIDARTDVYALGVTLYELLTLTLPHGDGTGETFSRILGGGAEALARRNANVHPDAEAICLQAMDPVLGRRYATAEALADDLARFVELRPVHARRQTTWTRAHRFVVRHPARAIAIALAVLLVLGAPSVLAWQEHAANVRIRGALDQAQSEHQLAAKYLDRALAAVDQMLSRTANDRLRKIPRAARLREQLLQDALAFHLELAESQPGMARLLLESGRARRRVGEIRIDLGQVAAGVADLERARDELIALHDAAPSDASARLELARTRGALARANLSAGHIEAYLTGVRAALEDFEAVSVGDAPQDISLRLEIARARIGLAIGLSRSHDLDGANDALDAVDSVLGDAPPADLEPRLRTAWLLALGRSADARGTAAVRAGDTVRAGGLLELAARRIGAAADVSPDGPESVLEELAGVRTRAAFLLQQRRDWGTALPALDAAILLLTKLVEDQPDETSWWGQLATLLSTRGEVHTQLRDLEAARSDFAAAIARIDAAIERFPEEIGNLRARAIVHGEFANWCRVQGDRDAARGHYEASVAGFRAFASAVPDDEQAKGNLVASLGNSANAFAEWGDDAASRACLDEALDLARARRGGEAEPALIQLLCMSGTRAQSAADPDRADALLGEARTRASAWLAVAPDDVARMGAVLMVATESAIIELGRGVPQAAVDELIAAEPIAVRGAATGNAGNRNWFAILLLRRADAERACGRRDLARECFRRAIDEAGATRELFSDTPSLAAMFDDPEFADLAVRR